MNTFRSFALLCAVIAVALVSCSDNPADNPSDEHIEAFGLILYESGSEIVSYQNGVVHGNLVAEAGEDTPLLTLRFLDENGNVISSDKLGSKYSLKWEVGNTAIADVEQHDDDGKWNFHIVGKAEGETTLKIMLFHNDHADFTSKEIPVHVNPAPGVSIMTLLMNGTQVLTANEEAASGVASMFNGTTRSVELQFDDLTNNRIELDDEYTVEVVPSDASFVDVTAGTAKGTFNFTAKKEGITTFRVRLQHSDEHGHTPHVVYESPLIVLNIEA